MSSLLVLPQISPHVLRDPALELCMAFHKGIYCDNPRTRLQVVDMMVYLHKLPTHSCWGPVPKPGGSVIAK